MSDHDDAARLLARQDAADDDLTRRPAGDDIGAPCIVGKTVAVTSYPTTAGKFYGITPQMVLGTDTEGSAGALTAQAGTFLALHVGATAPPVGTTVICTGVAHRWIFAY